MRRGHVPTIYVQASGLASDGQMQLILQILTYHLSGRANCTVSYRPPVKSQRVRVGSSEDGTSALANSVDNSVRVRQDSGGIPQSRFRRNEGQIFT